MKFVGDYHLHTYVSDGRATVTRHVRAAKERGLCQIAVTDHSFSTFLYHQSEEKFEKQRNEILSLDDSGVKVFQGIEANIIGGDLDVPHSVIRKCDVLTAGFHRFISPAKMNGKRRFILTNGFGSKRAKERMTVCNTEAYISVMENYPVDVIAHLGHRAPVDIAKVCECAYKHNVYIELNAKHVSALADGITSAIDSGVKFIVGTDAHSADKTGEFRAVRDFIDGYGVPLDRVYGLEGNLPVFKDKKEWTYGHDV